MLKRFLALLCLAVTALAQSPATVASPKLTATFDNGRLVSLKNLAKQEILAPATDPALFSFNAHTDGSPVSNPAYFNAINARKISQETQPDGALIITYTDFKDAPGLSVTCRVKPMGDFLAWRFAARFPDSFIVENIYFPRVQIAVNDPEQDNAVYGANKASVLRPARLKPDSHFSVRQPGSMSAQFGCQNSGAYGFYYASHDPNCRPKAIHLKLRDKAMEWFWDTQVFLKGGSYAQPFPFVMTSYQSPDGSAAIWQDAADIYKQWARNQEWCQTLYRDRPDVPQWMKNGPGMVRFNRNWYDSTDIITDWHTKIWQKFFDGIPLVAAMWGWEKHDPWITPDYFPLYPNDQTATAIMSYLKQHGAHPFPWPSGYHWTLTYDQKADGSFRWDDRERFQQNYSSHAVTAKDGKMYVRSPSWLRKGSTATMCPGDPWTIDWWNQQVCQPLCQRGADMLQVDQVVGGNFPSCYSTSHPHPQGPGKWMVDAFKHQLRTMYTAMKEVTPEPVLAVEEPNEVFNHLVGIMDYRNCEARHEWASVFNYLYHEYLPVFQSNPRANNRLWEAHCAADAQIPHFIPRKTSTDLRNLANGDFEKGNERNLPLAWDKVAGWNGAVWLGSAELITDDVHGGSRALRLFNKPGETVQVSLNCPIDHLAVRNGARYRISGWLKTRKLARGNSINIAPLGAGLAAFGKGGHLFFPAADKGWTYVESFIEPTVEADYLRIMIHIVEEADVLVDDLKLEISQPDGSWKESAANSEANYYEFAINWVRAYHEHRQYLQHGTFLRPPQLDCDRIPAQKALGGWQPPAIFHNALRAPDGSTAVVLANATRSPQKATLHWQGKAIELTLQPAEIKLVK